jgi:MinD superfamily P-loop ATPase
MIEMVVIDGTTGVGEAGLAASLAVLADRPVIADCDVGTLDLQFLLSPKIRERHDFCSGHQAVVRTEECMSCGLCQRYCPNGAIIVGRSVTGSETYAVDPVACQGCGTCVRTCPVEAIDLLERKHGEWIVSDTSCGPMIHAQLDTPTGNSAELVSTIRREAHRIALEQNRSVIIVNGSFRLGFPVTALVLGASCVLVVTTPTSSTEHDLESVLSLVRRYNIPAAVCVNKWDLDVKLTERIEAKTHRMGVRFAGRIQCNQPATQTRMQDPTLTAINEIRADDVKKLWAQLSLLGTSYGRACR